MATRKQLGRLFRLTPDERRIILAYLDGNGWTAVMKMGKRAADIDRLKAKLRERKEGAK